jgi:hypothetical protein
VRYRTTVGRYEVTHPDSRGVLQLVVNKREDAFNVSRAAMESTGELFW